MSKSSGQTAKEEALEAGRSQRDRLERLAESDLPYAPYAKRVLRTLEDASTDE